MIDQPCEVPLVEQLRSVPIGAHEMIQVGECAHRNIPYGALCHRAADEIERLKPKPAPSPTFVKTTFSAGAEHGFAVLCSILFGFTPEKAPAAVAEDITKLREMYVQHAVERQAACLAIAEKLSMEMMP